MSIFDNFGKKVSGLGQQTVAKAKEWSDVTKLNSLISDEQKKIDECYKTIGKLYVAKHSSDCESEFSAAVAAIMESNAKIDDYKKQVQTAKGIKTCPQCGAEVASGSAFCSSCGYRMPVVEAIPDNMVKCQKCGAVVSKGMRFCTSCGNPMAESEPVPVISEPAPVEPQGQTCSACGAVVPDGYAFCTNCGTPVGGQPEPAVQPAVCPSCGAQVEEGIAFCTNCGKPLKEEPKQEEPEVEPESQPKVQPEEKQEESSSGKICFYCGAEVPNGFAFCTSCGRPMRANTSDSEASAPAEESND